MALRRSVEPGGRPDADPGGRRDDRLRGDGHRPAASCDRTARRSDGLFHRRLLPYAAGVVLAVPFGLTAVCITVVGTRCSPSSCSSRSSSVASVSRPSRPCATTSSPPALRGWLCWASPGRSSMCWRVCCRPCSSSLGRQGLVPGVRRASQLSFRRHRVISGCSSLECCLTLSLRRRHSQAARALTRVLVTNCVLLNGGDAAILMGITHLSAALGGDVEIAVADSQPEYEAALPGLDVGPSRRRSGARPDPGSKTPGGDGSGASRRGGRLVCRPGSWEAPALWLGPDQRAALARFAAADVVVSTGGTYLVEHYPLAREVPRAAHGAANGEAADLVHAIARPVHYRRTEGRCVAPCKPRTWYSCATSCRVATSLMSGLNENLHVVADAAFALSAGRRPREQRNARRGFRTPVALRRR